MAHDKLVVSKKKFNSRLIVGTGKYRNMSECAKAIEINQEIVDKKKLNKINLKNNDKIEIVHFIGGG